MAQITVTGQADGTFHVQTPAGTSHQVSVPAGVPARLGCSHVDPGELVRASFEFLLEREPAASILREFSLDVISQYFPSFLIEQLRSSLSSRTVIDQALGIIMAREHCSQARAFAILRSASQNSNVKLRNIASAIVTSITGEPPQPPPPFEEGRS